MNNNDKLNILKVVLDKYGLSLDDPEVHEFFFKSRSFEPNKIEEIGDDTQEYSFYTPVRPIKMKILPSDFENNGYGNSQCHKSISEWYSYENAGSNPLVWNNIGNPTFDVKSSYEKTRKTMGPVILDTNNKLYNGGDGNHRLLTLIINHFLERKSAKTAQEKAQVDRKYEMILDVAVPIKKELSDLLKKETNKLRDSYGVDDKNRVFPNYVCQFRTSTFENHRDAFYAANIDSKTGILEYNLNGEYFKGTEDELIEYLETKQQSKEPIMTWNNDGIYYLSCYNMVYKSRNKKMIDIMLPRVRQGYTDGKLEYNTFLEIKDVDSNTYELEYPDLFIEDKDKGKEFATFLEDVVTGDSKKVFFNKLDNYKTQEKILGEIERAGMFSWGFSMSKLHYKHLTREEYLKTKEMLITIDDNLEYINNNTDNVD